MYPVLRLVVFRVISALLPSGVLRMKYAVLSVFVSVVLRRKTSVVAGVVFCFSWCALMDGGVLSWVRK